MRSVWFRTLNVVAATVLFASACAGTEAPADGLSWSDCGDGFDCAKLSVPLDYGQPNGERIKISVVRLPATGDRIGSLVVNPGGPGSSGVTYARAARSIVSDEVRERFDVVGFDPRGVGESAPVECLSDSRLDAFIALDTTPDTPQERAALEQGSREFAKGCQSGSGRLLPHVGTVDAARDMDRLRQALGDQKLTYLGKSYGTFLGAVYADMFPSKVRALVLDGALDPAISRLKLNADQAMGFERALRAYLESCLAEGDCPFRSHTVDGALAEVTELLHRTDARPLPADGRQAGESLATLGALTPLYDRGSWPELTETFRQALNGDGRLLLRNADQLIDRRANGAYSNQTEANMAINCVDGGYPKDVSAYAAAATEAERQAPRFGAYLMWSSLPCAFWPAKPTLTNRPLTAKGAAPILVIGTERDPATPYGWAQALASELDSGVFLGYDGDGHTAYFNGSTCVDDAVDHYLLAGTPPQDGTVCPGIG
ncbi:alpha/beta hydrolase [Nonomuraea aurantiaca]|uniref:alpha/beta hydrolase n=1 Tax=Nonomuraea aurantiaca TaxID=2878562 RepID=UPI001CD9AC19|nr:alpha/beta hydrolase [Nonomuraea aurantiaca]MCA2229449.1 alpha/beta hydrolase [Nonomuraea aurantiaca]